VGESNAVDTNGLKQQRAHEGRCNRPKATKGGRPEGKPVLLSQHRLVKDRVRGNPAKQKAGHSEPADRHSGLSDQRNKPQELQPHAND